MEVTQVVCGGCGEKGKSFDRVKHAEDCPYVLGTAGRLEVMQTEQVGEMEAKKIFDGAAGEHDDREQAVATGGVADGPAKAYGDLAARGALRVHGPSGSVASAPVGPTPSEVAPPGHHFIEWGPACPRCPEGGPHECAGNDGVCSHGHVCCRCGAVNSCAWCAQYNRPVPSSVSESWVHTDTSVGRVSCSFKPTAPTSGPGAVEPGTIHDPVDDEKCIVCGAPALGQCENCDAHICENHESGTFDDVYTCSDEVGCSARIEEKWRPRCSLCRQPIEQRESEGKPFWCHSDAGFDLKLSVERGCVGNPIPAPSQLEQALTGLTAFFENQKPRGFALYMTRPQWTRIVDSLLAVMRGDKENITLDRLHPVQKILNKISRMSSTVPPSEGRPDLPEMRYTTQGQVSALLVKAGTMDEVTKTLITDALCELSATRTQLQEANGLCRRLRETVFDLETQFGLPHEDDPLVAPLVDCGTFTPGAMIPTRPNGHTLIMRERIRQIREEGWTAEHDDVHANGEMVAAAVAYLFFRYTAAPRFSSIRASIVQTLWPWATEWWKPKDAKRDLVRAAALLAAEIDRIQRVEDASLAQMRRDYAQPGDPYGISEYTKQSADQDVTRTASLRPDGSDIRGNSITEPRSVPTQAEADALKGDR